ncbi:MAG: LPS assembly protein LptD [Legionellales bacterium]|jgi:LPS-assembly protein
MKHRYIFLLCLAQSAYADTSYNIPPAISYSDGLFYDWQPHSSNWTVCEGAYMPPQFDANFSENETLIQANEVFLADSGASILAGDVLLNEKNRRIYSQKIYFHRDENGEISTIDSPGAVLLEEPEFRLASDNALIIPNGQTTLNQVSYRYYPQHARGQAQRVEYFQDEPTLLYHADYTTCSPDSNVWRLEGSEVHLNQETGRGEAYNSVMKIHDIPVFYTPYINFPIDDRRQSGFLMPSFGSQTDSGFIVSTPYYFNLAPNYDATFYPTYFTDRGLQYGGDLRYLDEYHQTQFYGAYLNHDRAFSAFQAQQQSDPTYPDPNDPRLTGVTEVDDNRWLIALTHAGEYGQSWDTELAYNKASDDNYFEDLSTEIFDRDQRELLQRAQINYVDDIYSASAMVQDYQILQPFDNDLYTIPYQILPHIEVDAMPDTEFLNSAFAANAQFTYFDHIEDPTLDYETPTTGARSHINPVMQTPMRKTYGYLLPSVEFRYTQYDLALSEMDAAVEDNNQISRALPTFYLDGGLMFDRDTNFLNKNYLQTLEPRIFYLYTPYENQDDIPLFDTSLYDFNTDQLFRTNRFNGLDRINDANQISAAITTRYFEEETGVERFKATVGQILYFEDRKVTLCDTEIDPYCYEYEDAGNDSVVSPFVGDLRYQFNQSWYSTMMLRLDPTPAYTDRYHLLFHYLAPQDGILHFGFNYDESGNVVTGAEPGSSEAELLQTDTGIVVPINPQWSLQSRWYYDIQNQFTVEIFGGIEYESCCWAVQAGARRYLEGSNEVITERQYDSQLFFQFIFKGLAGIGSSPANLLVETIPGYNDKFSGGNW